MLFAGYIANRLSLRRDADGKRLRSAGTVIATVGIALAIAIMLISIAVVTGFKKEIRDRVTGFNAPLTIYPADAFTESETSAGITLNDTLLTIIRKTLPEATVDLTIRQSAIFKTDDAFQGVVLKSTSGSATRTFIEKHLTEGSNLPLKPDSDSLVNTLVISRKTANALNVGVGDRLMVHFLRNNAIASRRLTVTGIFNSHFSEYDGLYAFTPLEFLRKLNRIDSLRGTEIELRGIDALQSPEAAALLDHNLLMAGLESNGRRNYVVENVVENCALYFNWLSLLDTNVIVIIVLMTLVAAFTLISCLFITILERVGFIGLFKALGATNAMIRRIFILLAERLVIRGLLWGNIVGLGIILIQHCFHIIPLDPDSYYLDYVPVSISWVSVLAVNVSAVAVSLAVLILPSHLIARLSPAETMRFE